jgi:intracellular sulfur oxidation DsrE/DsrF family protein
LSLALLLPITVSAENTAPATAPTTLPVPAPVAEKKIHDDAAALKGFREARGVFLIDFTDAGKTAFYLKVIRGTHQNFLRQGVKPELVLVFIGPTVKFLTTRPEEEIAHTQADALKAIAEEVRLLKELGVRMEVCAVATEVFKVDNASLHPGLELTGDGFVSLIGWQTQGYKLVPLF